MSDIDNGKLHDFDLSHISVCPLADENEPEQTCDDSVGPRSWDEAKRRGLDKPPSTYSKASSFGGMSPLGR